MMRRTNGHTAAALLTTASVTMLFGACAFPDFEFDGVGPGSGSTTDVTSSVGGMTGVGGMTTTSSTTTGGGMGGMLPTDCTLFTTGQCGPNRKCSIVDPATGEAGCVDAGDHPPWSRCQQDTDCGEDYFCSENSSTCRLICDTAADCGDAARVCAAAMQGGHTITTLGVCTANCHPATGTPCDTSEGSVNCVPTSVGNQSGLLNCAASGGKTFGQSCMGSGECALGLACVSENMDPSRCTPWCEPPDNSINNFCPVGAPVCGPTNPNVTHNSVTFGVCGSL